MIQFTMRSTIFFFLLLVPAFQLSAQCDSDAGTMNLTAVEACSSETLTVQNTSGEFLDADDVLLYYLHEGNGSTLLTPLASSTDPTFSFDGATMTEGITYYISAVVGNNDGSGGIDLTDVCLSVAPGTPVSFLAAPTAVMSGDASICEGEAAAISIDFTGEAPWSFLIRFGNTNLAFTNISDNPFTFSPRPATSTSYTIASLSDANCPGVASGTATVTVSEQLEVFNVNTACNGASYTLSFGIHHGDTSAYSVNPPNGTITGTTFTSDPIPGGTAYSFEVFDNGACGAVVLSGVKACDCDSKAGSMDPAPLVSDGCTGDPLTAVYDNTDEVLDSDDALTFILHTNEGNVLGEVIQTSDQPSFAFQGASMDYGVVYYVSAVVGNDNGNGSVDLSDPCLDVAVGTPVTFHELIRVVCDVVRNCDATASVICTASGGTPNYNYDWTGPSGETLTGNFIDVFDEGDYVLTVTDAMGCSATTTVFVFGIEPPFCQITPSGNLSCSQPLVQLDLQCFSGNEESFQWSTGETSQSISVSQPGTYSVTITTFDGCMGFSTIEVTLDDSDCGTISGYVNRDENGNCLNDPGELPLGGWMVQAAGAVNFYGFTDEDGFYEIFALPGNYDVSAVIPFPGNYWEACTPTVNVTLADANDTETADFTMQAIVDCPLLEVDISTPLLRRCFVNTYNVSYCNNGAATAEETSVEVSFDPLFNVQSSDLPYTGPVNGVYTFAIGTVGIGECGGFNIEGTLSCAANNGQSICAEAHIFPDSLCTTPSPEWSGANIEITSDCDGDELVFSITNVGAENMAEPSNFIVIEDGVMLTQPAETFLLASGETTTASFPANGSTYTIIAEQVAGLNNFSSPILTVEGCGTNSSGGFSTGFALQFPQDDESPFLSIDCQQVVGSYDPNDKRGYPLGLTDEHLIGPGQDLEYKIRFQNTGTDTAFTVVVQDVLPAELDITSLRPGASSHPYKMEILGSDTLVFRFENILLPDSNSNEALSHGFIKFRVSLSANAQTGDLIENEAAIFFDFNDAVLTNRTLHKIGEQSFPTPSVEAVRPALAHAIVPNPTSGEATLLLSDNLDFRKMNIRFYDVTGQPVLSEQLHSPSTPLHLQALPPGIYFYKIKMENGMTGEGKVVRK
ncbi:MAG TPA: T9SS type A sorting domain-containing protein [Bacteroidetes bacterium]|nr:T9SS type A sorting domain-containing protein [Bacteroidota bacterium]